MIKPSVTDRLANQQPARPPGLRQHRPDHLDIADHLPRQPVQRPALPPPVRRPRSALPRYHLEQVLVLIEKQHAVQKRQLAFELEQRIDITGLVGLIGDEIRHARVIGQRRELVETVVEKRRHPVRRRQRLGIEAFAGQAVEQILGQLLIEHRQGNKRYAHDHDGQQGIARHQTATRPGQPPPERARGVIGIHGICNCCSCDVGGA
ncbi:hypothetical protein D3C77_344120 [compost metagenome]